MTGRFTDKHFENGAHCCFLKHREHAFYKGKEDKGVQPREAGDGEVTTPWSSFSSLGLGCPCYIGSAFGSNIDNAHKYL